MKIVFTGGGTGGHFYPLLAVADEVHHIVRRDALIEPELIYMAPFVLDQESLMQRHMRFVPVSAGKKRKYFSIRNYFDYFVTAWGILQATWKLYRIFPDVVFSKGGYAAFPVTVAARFLGIPLIIHESDAHPGLANVIASKWAKVIAVSYPEVVKFFPKSIDNKRFVLTGNPVRPEMFRPVRDGAYEFLDLEQSLPTLLVLGGSSGAKKINDILLDALPTLVQKYQIIHQTGSNNFEHVKALAEIKLKGSEFKERYKPYGYLSTLALRMAFGLSSLVISRAGSGVIFEIAAAKLPSIIIPIPEDVSHDQTHNAFAYASAGATVVIKQKNLTATILENEVERIMRDPVLWQNMRQAAENFAKPEASYKIADMLLKISVDHEE